MVKRYCKPTWGPDWREHFSVDIINGTPGNELKCDKVRKLVTTYFCASDLTPDGAWRTFGLRKDFHPAVKVQLEDDITASVVVPAARLENLPRTSMAAQVAEVRSKLRVAPVYQRPDDAIHRGYDKQTEADFTMPENFFSNYEPLTPDVGARAGGGRHRVSINSPGRCKY